MHSSCLGAVMIDCWTEDLEAAGAFWATALGHVAKATDGPRYHELDVPREQPTVVIQRVEQIKTWWVMKAPTGQRFCVIGP